MGEGVGFINMSSLSEFLRHFQQLIVILYGEEFEQQGVMPSDQLFLFGSSQGGHAKIGATLLSEKSKIIRNLTISASRD